MDAALGAGGGRFRLRGRAGDPPCVEKTGAPVPLANEAAALRLLAGVDGVPRLVAEAPGVLVSTRLPGAPRPLAGMGPAGLRRLGALLGRVHAAAAGAAGGLPWWDRAVPDGAAYAAARARDADRAASAAGLRLPDTAPPPAAPVPFRPVHGDLTAGNVVWDGEVPGVVDWEFWHWGDPAEDLAYLIEANHLDPEAAAHVLAGHRDGAAAGRVEGWRPVALREIAAWWCAEGRPDLAAPHLARLGVTPPSGPSTPTPPGAA